MTVTATECRGQWPARAAWRDRIMMRRARPGPPDRPPGRAAGPQLKLNLMASQPESFFQVSESTTTAGPRWPGLSGRDALEATDS